MEAARSMLYDRALPIALWAEAVHHANYVLHRTLSKGGLITPFEAFHGFKPDLKKLFIFGSTAYYHVPSDNAKKPELKCLLKKCI
jgi:hypothetical protein